MATEARGAPDVGRLRELLAVFPDGDLPLVYYPHSDPWNGHIGTRFNLGKIADSVWVRYGEALIGIVNATPSLLDALTALEARATAAEAAVARGVALLAPWERDAYACDDDETRWMEGERSWEHIHALRAALAEAPAAPSLEETPCPLCETASDGPLGGALGAAMEALKFYADPHAWNSTPSPIMADGGSRAELALTTLRVALQAGGDTGGAC